MELSTSKIIKVKQADIEEAVLNLVFKKKPELRPSGIDASDDSLQIHFSVAAETGVTAIVMLEAKCEEITKT